MDGLATPVQSPVEVTVRVWDCWPFTQALHALHGPVDHVHGLGVGVVDPVRAGVPAA